MAFAMKDPASPFLPPAEGWAPKPMVARKEVATMG